MNKKRIDVKIGSNAMHNEQILTAVKLWSEKNGYYVSVELLPGDTYPTVVKVLIHGTAIIVDNADTPLLQPSEQLKDVSAYFKRSFIKDIAAQCIVPVFPFGFNYAVVHKPFSISRIRSLKTEKVFISRALPILNNVSNMSYGLMSYRRMMQEPTDNGGRIIMLSRLWDPDRVSTPERKHSRMQMNEVRIETITALRKAFGQRVVCGLEDSYLSKKIKPDYIVPKNITTKKKYLELLRSSDIGVATSGLEGTLGWRIGEYVAFSKAVVTEPFDVTIPCWNEFEHYLTFNSDDIVEQIDTLLTGKRYLAMQQANHAYYNEFLEPVNLFSRILKLSGIS